MLSVVGRDGQVFCRARPTGDQVVAWFSLHVLWTRSPCYDGGRREVTLTNQRDFCFSVV